ncbi:MAG: NVEALA domain-containing protein [Phocaeicola sp.]|uniref:NVEALA domain-containing protein n=1 Tax=Phocaeicola sp. TaxID=2773926 RepID=UPI0023BE05CD|nr:NVEALA domain-containing protein [Phocaeicola sp.]MDE5677879.1 NVEALA domain-containing protein [Phocaeicola sp.]MDE6179670.1 NVEALA domain-containing protein [Phocaeicola sp.]
MGKKIFAALIVAVVAILAGYNIYQSQRMENDMSDLMLANVEALARYELPEVEVVCGSSQGKCWMQGDLCMKGEYTGYRCIRTDNTIFYCTSPCM